MLVLCIARSFPKLFRTGPSFNIKVSSNQYRKSHCGNKTVVRSSYLHNGISYTGKMTSLYWISPQVCISLDLAEIYRLAQNYNNSSAFAMDLPQYYAKPSKWYQTYTDAYFSRYLLHVEGYGALYRLWRVHICDDNFANVVIYFMNTKLLYTLLYFRDN